MGTYWCLEIIIIWTGRRRACEHHMIGKMLEKYVGFVVENCLTSALRCCSSHSITVDCGSCCRGRIRNQSFFTWSQLSFGFENILLPPPTHPRLAIERVLNLILHNSFNWYVLQGLSKCQPVSQGAGEEGGGGRIFLSFHSQMLDITIEFCPHITVCILCVYTHTQRAVVCSAAV